MAHPMRKYRSGGKDTMLNKFCFSLERRTLDILMQTSGYYNTLPQ